MGVVLGELPHAGEAVEDTGFFVAVHRSEFEEAYRKIAVAAAGGFVDHHVGEAVHRLDAVALAVNLGEIHVFPVVVVVPGTLPELLPEKTRSEDDVVPPLQVLLALELLDEVAEEGAPGVPDDHPRADIVGEGKKVELPAQLAVVPLLGLFQALKVLLEPGPVGIAGAVDPLEHGIALVSAPVGAGDTEELEGDDPPGGGICGPRQRSTKVPCR